MKVNFGVASGRNDRIDEIAELARAAEQSGFSHLSFLDSQNRSRDVYVMMTIAMLNSRRIHTWQTVTNPFTRHPSVTANATATVNELSGGRAFLGIGAGGTAVWTMGGNPRPLRDLRDMIIFVRKYTAGEEAEWYGASMHSEWIRQPLKIYLAAEGPKGLELAGELADGIIFTGGPSFVIKWKMDHIAKGAEKAGRNIANIDIVVRSDIYVADSKEKAHGELASHITPYAGLPLLGRYGRDNPEIIALYKQWELEYPGMLDEIERVLKARREETMKYTSYIDYDPWHERANPPWAHLVTQRMFDAVHLTGTPEDICEGVYRYAKLGVNTIAPAVYGIIDKKGMIREIGDKILPHFRN